MTRTTETTSTTSPASRTARNGHDKPPRYGNDEMITPTSSPPAGGDMRLAGRDIFASKKRSGALLDDPGLKA